MFAAVCIAACEPVDVSSDAPPLEEPLTLDAQGLSAADLERGEALSLACLACHHLGPDQGHNIGPNLYGMFGRRAAMADDFDYSDALVSSDLVWSPETLDAWLLDPIGYVPGSTMAFFGYSSARDRRDLIAYLMRATGASMPTGEPAAP